MDVDKYLLRINCSSVHKAYSVQNLYTLQKNHLLNVPFENLDIHLRTPIELDLDAIYEKVVVKKRGGCCFELNQLFMWLLEQLGYSVKLLAAKLFVEMTGNWLPWMGHAQLLVNISESNYLVDVGMVQNNRTPLKFNVDTVQTDLTGHFKINKDEENEVFEGEPTYVIKKCWKEKLTDPANWQSLVKFSLKGKPFDDFRPMASQIQTKENPRFFNRSICVIHTSFSALFLVGFRLTELKYANSLQKSRTDSNLSRSEVFDAIKNIYGIQLNDEEFEPTDDERFGISKSVVI